MIFSNSVYNHLKRQAGRRNRAHLDRELDEFWDETVPDWLFFTELNAHEVPGKKTMVLEE